MSLRAPACAFDLHLREPHVGADASIDPYNHLRGNNL